MTEELIDLILDKEKEGCVVFMTIEGPASCDLDDFIKQPTDGLLYDLNRDRVTTLSLIKKDPKWVNDFAVGLVIKRLKELLEEDSPEKGQWYQITTSNFLTLTPC